MTPAEVKQSYIKAMNEAGETIIIRRLEAPGSSPAYEDTPALRARVTRYDERELVGTIQQGDRKIILLADDVANSGLSLPLTANDKIMLRGKRISIVSVDDSTRRVQGVLIAYEIQARG